MTAQTGDALTEALIQIKGQLGRQGDIARETGLDAASISRVITGSRFAKSTGRALIRRFPELREPVANALLDRAS